MGKYTETPGENWKLILANELAEANRLKRLELLRLHLPYSDERLEGWEKELEDQA